MRIIKRYSNRRLYDTDARATITQRDVADLIKAHEDVKIIDSTTGNDLTLPVLGRIILAETASWDDPSEFKVLLTRIIELEGGKSMSILKNTVLASVGAFQVTKTKAEKIIDDLIKKGEVEESERKTAVMELLDKADKSTAKFRDKVSAETGKAIKEVSKVAKDIQKYKLVKQTDIKKLETKVDKLTQLVKQLEKKLAE